jgi:hypothetical protein
LVLYCPSGGNKWHIFVLTSKIVSFFIHGPLKHSKIWPPNSSGSFRCWQRYHQIADCDSNL